MADKQAAREVSLAVRRLLQAGRGMQAVLARKLSLRVTDVQALDHVVSSPEPIGPGELGHRLGITSASATVLADRLAAAGHLARRADPADRRRVHLEATDHAREDIRAALGPLLAEMEAITDRLKPEHVPVVLSFLDEVAAAMRAYDRR
ncbi:MarR family winged helix-turn-helix transcriptional regulator [Amycolatopsis rubida]|uniref:DNA-binding transcriptional regulator, MarR family n=1 Tax=Amycolatopsis rubida TaxID=112413 RepID=A0A1I5NHD7_9PSEU|nr:MarR family winged helix-turn-helix transcriptional regulator [Amycolatopsis rubida]SFP21122.1 DNA-binding transcriptional regulator, MarR family [Amycolatopsis rubida]